MFRDNLNQIYSRKMNPFLKPSFPDTKGELQRILRYGYYSVIKP